MKDYTVIERTAALIEEQLDQDLSLDEISREMGYSKFHLNRLFSEEVGCTMHKYIQMRRLTVAAWKLIKTEDSILDIAFEAHYQSQQAFTRAFHSLYGCPPQRYREQGIFDLAQSQYRRRTVKAIGIQIEARRNTAYLRVCLKGGIAA